MDANRMPFWWTLCCLALICGCAAREVPVECSLLVKDLPKYEPLIIIDGKLAMPDASGDIIVDVGSKVVVACPGTKGFDVGNGPNEIDPSCQGGDKLTIRGKKVDMQQLNCRSAIRGEILVKDEMCAGRGTVMELGFLVENKWYGMINVCHDNDTSSTFYAANEIFGASLPASENKNQHGSGRPTFSEGSVYQKIDADNCYKQATQVKTFTKLLGTEEMAKTLLKKSYISRGHLAPNSDFVLDVYQDLSFFYINTAPQWQKVNAGNWLSVESSVRNIAKSRRTTLKSVTGTYGVLKMLDNNGTYKEVWMCANKTKSLPVPEYFWKVLYDPRTEEGIAFVSLNNMWEEPAELFCPNICSRYGWGPAPKGRGKTVSAWQNYEKGYVYCCEVDALRRVIEYIPQMTVKKVMTYNG